MKFKNIDYVVIESTLNASKQASGYAPTFGEPQEINFDFTKPKPRFKKLANCKYGTGHDNFLKGVIVQFDMSYTQYFTPQMQRYNWIDIISSQSKMVA